MDDVYLHEQVNRVILAISEMTTTICKRLDEQTTVLHDIRDHHMPRKHPEERRPTGGDDSQRFTVVGAVASCNRPMKDGEYAATSKGNPYWKLALETSTGHTFKITLFSEKAAQFAILAMREQRPVIVEYTKAEGSKYEDFKTIRYAGPAPKKEETTAEEKAPF